MKSGMKKRQLSLPLLRKGMQQMMPDWNTATVHNQELNLWPSKEFMIENSYYYHLLGGQAINVWICFMKYYL